jgi:membrane protease YdiL (CAAX protease family)
MPTTIADDSPASSVAHRGVRWKTQWLVIGLAALFLFRSLAFVDRAWLSGFPPWLLLVVTGLTFQVFLLIYPIITCDPARPPMFAIPTPGRWLIEVAIAIPVVIGTVAALAALNYLIGRASPGTSLAPNFVRNMARSPDHLFVSLLLLFAFTFAPIAEEVFFRWFLHNAFRARMPFIVAVFAQSLIFGFAHVFGVAHASVAFVLGLLLTVVYEWRQTLIAPILLHAGINFITAVGVAITMILQANSPVMGVIGDPQDAECVIRQIVQNSAADEAGLQVGDIITSFNSEPIRTFPHLVETVQRYRAGDNIPVTIRRSAYEFQATVVLRRRGDP